jgi:hypothetical protein
MLLVRDNPVTIGFFVTFGEISKLLLIKIIGMTKNRELILTLILIEMNVKLYKFNIPKSDE